MLLPVCSSVHFLLFSLFFLPFLFCLLFLFFLLFLLTERPPPYSKETQVTPIGLAHTNPMPELLLPDNADSPEPLLKFVDIEAMKRDNALPRKAPLLYADAVSRSAILTGPEPLPSKREHAGLCRLPGVDAMRSFRASCSHTCGLPQVSHPDRRERTRPPLATQSKFQSGRCAFDAVALHERHSLSH